MLRELHISNLAVIEDVTLELTGGLNCFTGQTGAGKSLVLGAFEILLGLRTVAPAEVLRPGAEEGRVSGVFEIRNPQVRAELTRRIDLRLDPDDDLLITRKLFRSGRGSAAINGKPATASMVREIGELLVDIHGQHDHQFLLKPSNQLAILDNFGRCCDLRQSYGEVHAEWRRLQQRGEQLRASAVLRRQQRELYEFQAREIDDAQLVEGEYAELKARHGVLANLTRIRQQAGQAHAALYEGEAAVVERLQMIAHVVADLSHLDEHLKPIAEQLSTATIALQEAAFDLGRYTGRLDLDPRELAEIEDRLNTLNRLASKYGSPQRGGDPVADLLEQRRQMQANLDALRDQDHDVTGIDARLASRRGELTKIGEQLGIARRAAAGKLKPLVEGQLRDLGMSDAEFHAEFQPAGAESASGAETMEIMVRTNPGQPARPLRKIASGGELSRVMLALKSILAHSDRISVLVFDEIDANIGGRMGTVIGQKLRQLARNHAVRNTATGKTSGKTSGEISGETSGGGQVLCITHLPQIAVYADRHLRIAKTVIGQGKDRQTRTSVTLLTGPQRIEELAEMLAGRDVSATTRRQVKEMLDLAAT